MKRLAQLALSLVALLLFAGCVATVPIKVAAKTAKVGVKTGVKATAKAGSLIIPDGDRKENHDN